LIPVERRLPATIFNSAHHRYRILALLGEGGYGSVFKAIRLDAELPVAIKLINPAGPLSKPATRPTSQQQQRQLRNEITLCRTLHNANIAKLHDWGESRDGQVFAVFEYLPGQTLRERLLLHGAMGIGTAACLMGQVLAALVYLHGQGIVHCDIKPQNIMLPQGDTAAFTPRQSKLIDFGGALRLPSDREASDHGYRICSPSYSAPEQLRGAPVSQKFDIYAWGLVLLECLGGKAVITGHSQRQLVQQQISDDEIPIPAGLASHPLAALLRQVLHKDGRQRIGDTELLQRQFLQLDLAVPDDYRQGPQPQPASGFAAHDHAVTQPPPYIRA